MSNQEITLTFRRERVRFPSPGADPGDSAAAILECDDPDGKPTLNLKSLTQGVLVKTDCRPDELTPGLDYRFFGQWRNHPRHGRQFVARNFAAVVPHTREGVIKYLQQAPGIGQKTAAALWDAYQSEAVTIARTDPAAASRVSKNGFTPARAATAAAWLAERAATESTTVDLVGLLDGRHFPRRIVAEAIREWGSRAAVVVRRNPYLLMRFSGCSFALCDQLYLDTGGDPARRKRQAMCVIEAIRRDRDGHTWYDPAAAVAVLRGKLAGAEARPIDAVKLAKRAGRLAVHRDAENHPWLAMAEKAANERAIANAVIDRKYQMPCWPMLTSCNMTDHQRDQLDEATESGIGILTGGPGTGKTHVLAELVAAMLRGNLPADRIGICAPTNLAALRISDFLQSKGIDQRACTIHSLLGVRGKSAGSGWAFRHHAENPLPHAAIILDEASMCDVDILAALLRACRKSTQLLMVGDAGQLPPVGHGAPLRDLIAAGVPCGELTEIHRNDGAVVRACEAIRAGRKFQTSDRLRPDAGENLRLLHAATPEHAVDKILGTIRTLAERGLADPVRDCQVVVAVNTASKISRKAINERMQSALNPGGDRVEGNPFRSGDKIVCMESGRFHVVEDAPPEFNEDAENGKVFAAKGEQGIVKMVAAGLTVAQLAAPARLIRIPMGGDAPRWDLAYAVSCHKAQGSEWPIVLVVLDEAYGAEMVCSREWLYTAVSRAKTACFLVGRIGTAYRMIGREAIGGRKTFLKELIAGH